MLNRLYARTLALASSRYAVAALAVIAFAESAFFPLPPDLLLIPMILARPRQAFLLAGLCTVMSVLGGFLGYAIGYFLFDAIGRPILEFYHAMGRYEALKAGFAHWGVWIIIIKGLTPIPYKLVTIASGVVRFPIVPFAFASLVSRSLRFFSARRIAVALWRAGSRVHRAPADAGNEPVCACTGWRVCRAALSVAA